MKKLLIAGGIFLLVISGYTQTFHWQSYTNTDDVKGILWHNGKVWCATTGGLMAYQPESQSFQVWTNSEGLTDNNLNAIGVDFWGRIWIGLANAEVNIIDSLGSSVTVRQDLSEDVFEITAIDSTHSWTLVAHDKGLTIYQAGEGAGGVQVVETVRKFGDFPSNSRVSDIAVVDTSIWVSTFYGVAQASLSNPPLSPPSAWTNYTIAQGLPQNDVLTLVAWQGTVVVGTAIGTARFNGQQFEPMGAPFSLMGLYAVGDSLWAWTSGGFCLWNGSQWQSIGGNHPDITGLAQDDQGRLWAGHRNRAWARGSLAFFSQGQWSSHIIRNGISWSKIHAVFVDSFQRLWVAGSGELEGGTLCGLNMLDENGWHNWTQQDTLYNNVFFNNQGRTITEDTYGSIWGGNFGGGLINVRDIVDDTLIFDLYYYNGTDSSRLFGIPANHYYVVIQDLALDNTGNLWIMDRSAYNGKILVKVPDDYLANPQPGGPNTWNYFSVTSENLDPDQDNLLVDSYGRVWVAGGDANESPGKIYVLVADSANYDWTVFTFESSLLVNDMAIDHSGTLWLATRDGIYYAMIPQDLSTFDILPFYGAVGGNVQTVHVDAQDNKWFGTDRGISVLNAAYTWTEQFPVEQGSIPGGLVGGNIQKIYSNYANGDVWVATLTGLSLVKTPYRLSTGHLSTVRVSPNPFHPDGSTRLQFSTVDFNRALIYTITGKRIRDLTALDAMMGWDGRDSNGDLVSGGVYVILVTSVTGNSKLGKVAVVR
jgi:hypothetical protein